MDITIVSIDNGDTEPELWAFENYEDAERFAEVRGGDSDIQSVYVHTKAQALDLIANEIADAATNATNQILS